MPIEPFISVTSSSSFFIRHSLEALKACCGNSSMVVVEGISATVIPLIAYWIFSAANIWSASISLIASDTCEDFFFFVCGLFTSPYSSAIFSPRRDGLDNPESSDESLSLL